MGENRTGALPISNGNTARNPRRPAGLGFVKPIGAAVPASASIKTACRSLNIRQSIFASSRFFCSYYIFAWERFEYGNYLLFCVVRTKSKRIRVYLHHKLLVPIFSSFTCASHVISSVKGQCTFAVNGKYLTRFLSCCFFFFFVLLIWLQNSDSNECQYLVATFVCQITIFKYWFRMRLCCARFFFLNFLRTRMRRSSVHTCILLGSV